MKDKARWNGWKLSKSMLRWRSYRPHSVLLHNSRDKCIVPLHKFHHVGKARCSHLRDWKKKNRNLGQLIQNICNYVPQFYGFFANKKNIARLITEENKIERKKRTQTQGLWLNSWFQGLVVETIGGEGQFWLRKDTFFSIHPVIDREIKPSTFHILDRNLKETTRWVMRLYAAMNVLRRIYSFQMCTFQWKHKTIQFTAHLF